MATNWQTLSYMTKEKLQAIDYSFYVVLRFLHITLGGRRDPMGTTTSVEFTDRLIKIKSGENKC